MRKVEVQVEDGSELSAVTQERPDKKKRVSWDAPQRREKITDGRDDGRVPPSSRSPLFCSVRSPPEQ
ncbi:hypothetical protein BHE74_00055678 [Ensete ventricosum]|nr:hypothetical protein BHE74_00055678 [Ensete ventricosum]